MNTKTRWELRGWGLGLLTVTLALAGCSSGGASARDVPDSGESS